ncbi:Ectoine hydroxylase-related dioxygenase, phytanoyl-CoA dioxygenase (PhyH) family [Nocardioides terrae]|uniref:Ectoine hydroxylase-related dioxygenase, phytanoyl-CoA dioxygenase (PhyH) family n=1 Tax=Nocardioides terrae TaxID=574651 RepID=A0A1I1IX97_9ACTN|nr:phytanoyl-CoA dioxygenase family protein [Nocardioides terrae]SFC37850.1 Ectoine hydroxylase-related dioxygenase, phytanoyl-CoA dioxygenase (PhyH) family [Nocardioides terrae]
MVPLTSRLRAADCRLEDLVEVVSEPTRAADYPHAETIEQGVVVYDSARLRDGLATEAGHDAVASELVHALAEGPGIVVLRAAFPDHDVVDRATAVFDRIIADERAAGGAHGDHFAAPGANDRIWNALEKLAVRDPATFVDYYANELVALVSTAWLGPGYQVTSQVNLVRPGGLAQEPHRDYHLGFLADDVVERYPAHAHLLSPVLTLQGAVAHCDMPVESGPTMYLPHSQKYAAGYLAWRRPEFRDHFAGHHVQLPLRKGDAVFFNPAVLHGAGSNVSEGIQRMANLLQVSSAFGRAMESVDRDRVSRAVHPALRQRRDAGVPDEALAAAVAAAAEGYPFPTNLDLDQPVGALTPPTQGDLLRRALAEDWSEDRLAESLDAYAARRATR